MSALPWDAPPCSCPAVECVCPTAEHDRHCPVHGDYDAVMVAVTFDPECPEHRLADPSPASGPDARTVYCAECGGPSDVVDVTTEENHDGQWRVTLLDCDHQEATPR